MASSDPKERDAAGSDSKTSKLKLNPAEKRAATNLRRIRSAKRFSVRSLSEATEQLVDAERIGPNAISQIENAKRRMSLADAWTLARALGVSPLEFFLPIDEHDGEELGAPDDFYGPRVLPRRIVRALYRMPHESNADYVIEEAEAAMAREVAPHASSAPRVEGQLNQLAALMSKLEEVETDVGRMASMLDAIQSDNVDD